jgi:hypothetical protein
MHRSVPDCTTLHQFAHSSAACFPVIQTSQAEGCSGFVLTVQNSTKCSQGRLIQVCLGRGAQPTQIHPQYVLINAIKLLSACRSLFLPLKLVHLHHSSWLCRTFSSCRVTCLWGAMGDCSMGYCKVCCPRKHSLTSCQDCFSLQSIAPRTL